jgi:hypothetical protein
VFSSRHSSSVLTCAILAIALCCSARADNLIEHGAPSVPKHVTTRSHLAGLSPVALLSQAVARLVGADRHRTSNERGADAMHVTFSEEGEPDIVSLVLAQSQLRVRLSQAMQLRCELSSLDQANTDPELKLDLRLHFTFR